MLKQYNGGCEGNHSKSLPMKNIKCERIRGEGKEKKDKRKGKDKNRIDISEFVFASIKKKLTFTLANSQLSFVFLTHFINLFH